jgi:hypothetical protein
MDAVLSPDGNRIAWLLPENERPPSDIQTWLIRYNLASATPNPDTALWISDQHGHGMRLVKEWNRGDSQLSSLQWCPDGSHVSFEAITESPSTVGVEADLKIDTIAVGR